MIVASTGRRGVTLVEALAGGLAAAEAICSSDVAAALRDISAPATPTSHRCMSPGVWPRMPKTAVAQPPILDRVSAADGGLNSLSRRRIPSISGSAAGIGRTASPDR
jgi:hypothetical protein